MTKRRVYELAKDYGMKGPEMAKLLRELGFEVVKTHMAVLDEPLQMQIQGRLEAAGVALSDEPPATVEESEAAPQVIEPALLKPLKKKLPTPVPTPLAAPPAHHPAPPHVAPAPPHVAHHVPPAAHAPAHTGGTPAHAPAPRSAPEPVTVAHPAQEDTRAAAHPAAHKTEERKHEPVAGTAAAETASAARRPEPHQVPHQPTAAAHAEAQGSVPSAAGMQQAPSATVLQPASPGVLQHPAPPGDAPAMPAAAGPTGAVPPTDTREVKKLRMPEPRAKVLGRIELSSETIRDAGQRSAPAGERNPSKVDPNLRRQLMDRLRTRSSQQRSDVRRSGPAPKGPTSGGRSQGSGLRRPFGSSRRSGSGGSAPSIDLEKIIQLEPPVSVKRLSEALGIKVGELLGILMQLGVKGVNINSFLDKTQVELVALEKGRKIEMVSRVEAEDQLLEHLGRSGTGPEGEEPEHITRPPIVTFMGHVDHGKTSLLDAIRASDVAAGEAGGITQHIGAYKVKTALGHEIVILDTPGHAAFTAMRAHGAKLTDVVVLVVAADDGVMPQTEEAINHAKAANVPIVVALNKCDKPEANPRRTRQQLATKGLAPEEWGGTVQMVECSALTKMGIEDLIERVELEAEVRDLKANPRSDAKGTVIEAKQTAGQGNVVSLLVMDGTLRRGEFVLCGSGAGRIRSMTDDHGRTVEEAGPSTPVEVIGLPELPEPGDKFYVVSDEKKAKEVAETRARKNRELSLAERQTVTLENLSARLAAQDVEEVRVILKADVMGSLEPIRQSLQELTTGEVRVNILHSALGGITETDVDLADASKAVIMGFNSVPEETARVAADKKGVQIRFYDVIYDIVDDVRKAMEGMLSPAEKEQIVGHAEVRQVFKASKIGNIAGCYVTDGLLNRTGKVRLIRDGIVIYTGKLASLRRIKEDVREVKAGFECGARIENYEDIKMGDRLECFEVALEKRTL